MKEKAVFFLLPGKTTGGTSQPEKEGRHAHPSTENGRREKRKTGRLADRRQEQTTDNKQTPDKQVCGISNKPSGDILSQIWLVPTDILKKKTVFLF